MGAPLLGEDEGLLLRGDSSIHSFFMLFAFDAVYLDASDRVVRIDAAMPPNRVGPIVRGARSVLELAPGRAGRADVLVGDTLTFTP
jgi:uncharacterized protein